MCVAGAWAWTAALVCPFGGVVSPPVSLRRPVSLFLLFVCFGVAFLVYAPLPLPTHRWGLFFVARPGPAGGGGGRTHLLLALII